MGSYRELDLIAAVTKPWVGGTIRETVAGKVEGWSFVIQDRTCGNLARAVQGDRPGDGTRGLLGEEVGGSDSRARDKIGGPGLEKLTCTNLKCGHVSLGVLRAPVTSSRLKLGVIQCIILDI